ncbi:MAG: phosphoribosylanthranilate isomerase [Verrucomicrobiales bacterium]|nr:phosphoribosylanthranilate isomerase [Verrucomicrobiales bacterium]
MSVTVKICGITSQADALAAAKAGADAVGLMFYEGSPRCVSLEAARAIVEVLPPSVARVGVFVNAVDSVVKRVMRECTLNVLQFHGEESPEFCAGFGAMTLKAIRVKDESSLAELERFGTDGFLLDAFSKDARGGTGEQFNWDLARQAAACGKPIFLAGGLTTENVAEAVRVAEPFAVDVSSGVESEPGKKDAEKMRAFVAAAKGA